MTYSMDVALSIALANGTVAPGYNAGASQNRKVNPATIKALAAKGLVTLQTSPDGLTMGRITDAGRAHMAGGAK